MVNQAVGYFSFSVVPSSLIEGAQLKKDASQVKLWPGLGVQASGGWFLFCFFWARNRL